ncbi:unnamed protein product, partial [marine sediment metagenome]
MIPGPEEKEKAFLERVKILEDHFSTPPQNIDLFLTDSDWE